MGALWRAYHGWREAAGPLADFVLPTAFLAEPAAQRAVDESPRAPRHPLARRLADGLRRYEARGPDAGGTIVFLEAAPRLALAVGAALQRRAWQMAPAFGRWPVPGAVLPHESLAAWLTAAQRERAPTEHPAPALCVLLDGERRRAVSPAVLRRRFDNRYDYGPQMLPPPTRLHSGGVSRAVWAGAAAALAPDLEDYAASLVSAGLLVELVRHADLVSTP